MPAGTSNRIVIEVDPKKKEKLYAALKARGLTMREWFLTMAERDLLDKAGEKKNNG